MKTPSFWGTRGVCSTLLIPAASLYGAVSRFLRSRKSVYRAPVPVICVGNLTAGGAGKTPTVIDLLQRLTARDAVVHAVSRGYGGSEQGPLSVTIGKHTAAEVGDEPLLIASYAPTWVSKDRADGVRAAVAAGAEVVVLDDGFQNPSVAKDLSIIVVDAAYGFGNELRIPAGPLRENISNGMARADAVLLIGDPAAHWSESFHNKPVLRAHLKARFSGISLDGARVLAFAGIGRPEKFFSTVEEQGAVVVDRESFPDHNVYSRSLIDRLMARAEEQNLMLVTTEKDAVKLPSHTLGKIWPVPIGLFFDQPDKIDELINNVLKRSQ